MSLLRRRLRFLSRFRDERDDQLRHCADLLIELPAYRLEEIIRCPDELLARTICAQPPHRVLHLIVDQTATWARVFTARALACHDIVGEVHRTHDLGADPHLTGVPIALETDKGVFVYKPRPVLLDHLYNEFVGILCECGIKYPPGRLKVSVKPGYGFIEYVQSDHSPVSISIEQFQMVGTVLAITYALCGTDFHYENIVFSQNRAFLVDLEGLLQPIVSVSGEVASDTLSVLNTGILPARVVSGDNIDFDPSIVGSRRFQFSCSYSTAMLALRAGFRNTYKVLQESRNQITQNAVFKAFARAQSRYISVQTIDYYRALSRFAKSIRATTKAGEKCDSLDQLYSELGSGDPFILFEKEALSQFCIPMFFHSPGPSTIVSEEGKKVSVKIKRDGFSASKYRISTLSPADLRRQGWFVECSFECNALNRRMEFQSSDEWNGLPKAALLDARRLIAWLSSLVSDLRKIDPSDTCFLVVPIYEDGQWRLHNRRLDKQESQILTDLLYLATALKNSSRESNQMTQRLMEKLAKRLAAAIMDQSDIERRIIVFNEFSREHPPPSFCVSNTEGPCSIVITDFLNGKRLAPERGEAFLRSLAEALSGGNLRYGGIFQVPSLYFSIGVPCLLLVLCILTLAVSQNGAEVKALNAKLP